MSDSQDDMEVWFVLACAADDSVSLVPQEELVVTDINTVQIGDEVKFRLGEKVHVGIVRHFGGDYSDMRQKQEEVRKENKPREPSFHAEHPRRTAVKAADKWASLKPGALKSKHSGAGATLKRRSSADMPVSLTSSDSEIEMTPEVRAFMAKMAAKQRKKDESLLMRRSILEKHAAAPKSCKTVCNSPRVEEVFRREDDATENGIDAAQLPVEHAAAATETAGTKGTPTNDELDVTTEGNMSTSGPSGSGDANQPKPSEGNLTTRGPSGNDDANQPKPSEGNLTSNGPSGNGDANQSEPSEGNMTTSGPSGSGDANQSKSSEGNLTTSGPSGSGVRNEPKPSGSGVRDEPRPSGSGDRDEPRPSGSGDRDEPRPSGSGVRKEPRPSGSGVRDEPRPSGSGVRDKPRPSGSGVRDEPRPSGSGVRDEPRPSGSGVRDEPRPSGSGVRDVPRPSGDDETFNMSDETLDIDDGREEEGSGVRDHSPVRRRGRHAGVPRKQSPKIYEGNMFNFKAGDKKVVELGIGSGIYVKWRDLKFAKMAPTPTSYARRLLKCVFTKAARSACSVGGKKIWKDKEPRPALDPKGIDAIVDCVCDKAKRANSSWDVPLRSALISAMNVALNEARWNERFD